jgi:hypothetical protein
VPEVTAIAVVISIAIAIAVVVAIAVAVAIAVVIAVVIAIAIAIAWVRGSSSLLDALRCAKDKEGVRRWRINYA